VPPAKFRTRSDITNKGALNNFSKELYNQEKAIAISNNKESTLKSGSRARIAEEQSQT
jgi:hypothetical protein